MILIFFLKKKKITNSLYYILYNKRHTIIPVNELCRICNKTLLTRQFYIFPCQHLFHADCLLNYVNLYYIYNKYIFFLSYHLYLILKKKKKKN